MANLVKKSDEEFSNNETLMAPPPLGPGAVRISAEAKAERYRQLYPKWRANGSQAYNVNAPPHSDDDEGRRFGVVQQSLLKDLRKLERAAGALERKLVDGRAIKWFTNTIIALSTQAIFANILQPLLTKFQLNWGVSSHFVHGGQYRTSRRYLQVFQVLQWFAYPIAFFQIARHEKRIHDTSNLRQDLLELASDVDQCREIPREIYYLSRASWDSVPWELIEDLYGS